ncbi:MAG: hypothetical protein E6P95_00945 [Candidatus Moraniibacteriota bacterium]|nr:MAG: hypothetical protein E6P95_00945 [Candidatus Moranbacteria bacterium]
MFISKTISPDQLGELVKRFVTHLSTRTHAEACFMHEHNIDWHIKELLDEQGGFACDWVESSLVYPVAYKGLRPVEEQVHLIADWFRIDRKPALKLIAAGLPEVPKWVEGWAALPMQEEFTGNHWKLLEDALIWLNTICGNEPGYFSSCGGVEGLQFAEHVRPHFVGQKVGGYKSNYPRNLFAWGWKRRNLGRIMIVPVQMGALRKGQSDRMVQAHCLQRERSEFPLGAFEVACLLAMHPSRIPEYGERALEVNAPGDEYTTEGYIKTFNCRWHQMGTFMQLERGGIPCFGFARGNIRNERNAPFTASVWNFSQVT